MEILKQGMTIVERSVQEAASGNEQLRHPKHKSIRIKVFRALEKAFGPRVYYLLVIDRIALKRIRRKFGAK